jgi:hypothetical protein
VDAIASKAALSGGQYTGKPVSVTMSLAKIEVAVVRNPGLPSNDCPQNTETILILHPYAASRIELWSLHLNVWFAISVSISSH